METEDRPIPWGRTAGLLMACVVTLVGAICRLEPFEILQRAVIAGVLVGLAVTWTVLLVSFVVTAEKDQGK